MKVSILIITAVIFLGLSQAYAETKTTDKLSNSNPRYGYIFDDATAEYEDTDTDANTQKGGELGVGADVVLWQSEREALLEEVLAEYRYDAHNRDHKGYLVARVNLWQKIKGFFKK